MLRGFSISHENENATRKAAFGGDGGIRTPDLYSAIVALSQLSYVPVSIGKNTLRAYQRSIPLYQRRFHATAVLASGGVSRADRMAAIVCW